jgi:hypothetical protein
VLCSPAASALTVFAPSNDAVKTWCEEQNIHLDDLFDDEDPVMAAKLLEVSWLWPQ